MFVEFPPISPESHTVQEFSKIFLRNRWLDDDRRLYWVFINVVKWFHYYLVVEPLTANTYVVTQCVPGRTVKTPFSNFEKLGVGRKRRHFVYYLWWRFFILDKSFISSFSMRTSRVFRFLYYKPGFFLLFIRLLDQLHRLLFFFFFLIINV